MPALPDIWDLSITYYIQNAEWHNTSISHLPARVQFRDSRRSTSHLSPAPAPAAGKSSLREPPAPRLSKRRADLAIRSLRSQQRSLAHRLWLEEAAATCAPAPLWYIEDRCEERARICSERCPQLRSMYNTPRPPKIGRGRQVDSDRVPARRPMLMYSVISLVSVPFKI